MVDIIFLLILAMAVIKGWRRGLVLGLFSFVCCIVGLAAAVKLSAVIACRISPALPVSAHWLPVIAFVLVFITVAMLVRWIARLIEGGLKLMLLEWLNKLAGILLFILLYMAVYSVVLFYATRIHMVSAASIQASQVYPWIAPWGPGIIRVVEKLIPFGQDMFTTLEIFFDKVAHHLN